MINFEELLEEFNSPFEGEKDSYMQEPEDDLAACIEEGYIPSEDDDGEGLDVTIVTEVLKDFDVDKCSCEKDIIFTVDNEKYYHIRILEGDGYYETTKITPVKYTTETREVKVLSLNGKEYLV